MMAQRRLERVAAALALCALLAAPASAQITTGNVTGTVKDAQGGVVPGATVVLISEARGTKLAPVVDERNRRLRHSRTSRLIPTPSKSRWTASRPSGARHQASAAATAWRFPALTLEVGGATETVNVTAEAALVQSQSAERSFAVSTEQIENLPINHGNFTSLMQLTPGVIRRRCQSAGGTRIGGAGQNNIMMDGISAMDTGNNGQMLTMNIESIAEVKVLTQGYQAEFGRSSGLQITAVTKSGTNRFRGSAYDLLTDSDWNTNRRLNAAERRSEAETESKTLGYSIGGPIGKPGGSNKLFFFYSHEYRPTDQSRSTTATRSACGCRPRSSAPGDFSQTLDKNGALFNFIKDPRRRRCSATDQAACFPTAACSARSRRTACIRPGIAILNRYPLPNRHADPGHELQLRARRHGATPDRRASDPAAGPSPRLPAVVEAARHRQVLRPARSACSRRPALIPGFTDVLTPVSLHHQLRGDGELHDQPDDLPRRHLRVHPQRAGRRQRERHPDERVGQPPERPAGLPADLSGRRPRDPTTTTRYEVLEDIKPPFWDGTQDEPAADLRLGRPHRRRAAEPALSWLAEHQPHAGRGHQLDQGRGPAHDQGRLLQQPQLQGAERRRRRHATCSRAS